MFTPQELTDSLCILTGAPFTLTSSSFRIKNGVPEPNPNDAIIEVPRLSPVSEALYKRACAKSGLEYNPARIPVRGMDSHAAQALVTIAEAEQDRLARLEAVQAQINVLTDARFVFDKSKKVLFSDLLSKPDAPFYEKAMGVLNEGAEKGIIERGEIVAGDKGKSLIAVMDVDPDRFKDFAERHFTFALALHEMNKPADKRTRS